MNSTRSFFSARAYWGIFCCTVFLIAMAYALYFINMIGWRESPDFSWRMLASYSGPNVVIEVYSEAEKAGLQVGDKVLAVNGETYLTVQDLVKLRHSEMGSMNSYTVDRNGQRFDITIRTTRMGLRAVFMRLAPHLAVSLAYVFMGVIVFLMKPNAPESWRFFLMTSCLGLYMTYENRLGIYRPLWLFDLQSFFKTLLPACLTDLALRFPKKRQVFHRGRWVSIAPYFISFTLFTLMMLLSSSPMDVPVALNLAGVVYLMFSVLLFLFSTLWNLLKEASAVIRLQSQVIAIGFFLGMFIPALDLILRSTGRLRIINDPTLGFAVLLSLFLLSIAYSIVKHDLFAIDTLVRRTYGYILSTAAVAGIYALIVLGLDVTFQSSEISRSPAFSIVFALGVVFFFRPIHERLQKFVDRVFYRQQYDYRKTIKDTSEAMISILDPRQICKMLVGTVVREMFLEKGQLLLSVPGNNVYAVQAAEGEAEVEEELPARNLPATDALPELLLQKKDAIFQYEADLNPVYAPYREKLKATFSAFGSELMLPLMYKEEMRGIISLGGKKSGKLFTREDLDLLKTISNQSAVALENARLFQENIEKTRMEEELAIARDLQMSMLPASCPQLEGFALAANSNPAREVGGDFFDFIEMGTGKLGLVVGDVTGKSVSGALVMSASRGIFRMLCEQELSVGDIMTRANRRTKKDIKSGMFVALLFALIEANNRTITLSSAGQTQPVHYCAREGQAGLIETEGDNFPLGILEDSEYVATELRLEPGDLVVFYTDGIVEAMNQQNEMFGFDRLLQAVQESGSLGADSLLAEIMCRVNAFVAGAPQHDDLTLIVLRALS